MLNSLVASLFMTSYVGLSTAVFYKASSSIAVVTGKSVELFCGTDDDNHVQHWDYLSSTSNNGSVGWTKIYNGVDFGEEFKSNMNWTQHVDGKLILQIMRIKMSNAGYYKCIRLENQDTSIKNTKETTMELIVLASDPQCDINQAVFTEGEYIELRCSLKYNGIKAPVMEWTNFGTEHRANISNRPIYSVTDTEVTSSLRVKADSSLHNSKYSCKCYFKQSCDQLDTSECKVPDYHYTWTSPIILVIHEPRNVIIAPLKDFFYPGESLVCSADGYPYPNYTWRNFEGQASAIYSGPVLFITKEMIRPAPYVFECRASMNETNVGITGKITFLVRASISTLTAATISMGVLAVLLFFGIFTIRLRRVKVRERAAEVEEPIENNDPFGAYVGIRGIPNYLEMMPVVAPDLYAVRNEGNFAIGGIAGNAAAAIDSKSIRSNGLHERDTRQSTYVGADGTEYMEMNGFRTLPTTNPPTLPSTHEPVLYASIDHTLCPPSPFSQLQINSKK